MNNVRIIRFYTFFQIKNTKAMEDLKTNDKELGNETKNEQTRECCKLCKCEGFITGNPTTVCRTCGHDWDDHKCGADY